MLLWNVTFKFKKGRHAFLKRAWLEGVRMEGRAGWVGGMQYRKAALVHARGGAGPWKNVGSGLVQTFGVIPAVHLPAVFKHITWSLFNLWISSGNFEVGGRQPCKAPVPGPHDDSAQSICQEVMTCMPVKEQTRGDPLLSSYLARKIDPFTWKWPEHASFI